MHMGHALSGQMPMQDGPISSWMQSHYSETRRAVRNAIFRSVVKQIIWTALRYAFLFCIR